ncbi:MAG: Sec-independent protein translocase protein TatB [Actinomycetota bacterium]|nr:Sec-independent protein translocase protein TatB [Actinomycetota bacterium]
MFNVGGPEVLVILLVALIVLGPDKLPKAVRSVGNVMSELRRMSGGFQDEIRNALDMSTETQARHDGAQLARRPEEADITETVARNADPTPSDIADGSALGAGDTTRSNGATASSDLAELEPPDHERADWVPSDRASG